MDNIESKLAALNVSFLSALQKVILKNPSINLNDEMFQQYIHHLNEISDQSNKVIQEACAKELNGQEQMGPDNHIENEILKRSPDDASHMQTGLGEEEDLPLSQLRCKLFQHDASKNSWIDIGIGTLKLNKLLEKHRLIFRLEGSGKTLVNTWIDANFRYSFNNSKEIFLCIPVSVDSFGSAAIAKYFVRCKSISDASNFAEYLSKING
jgi:RanBP1 domain-containing protein